MNNEDWKNVKGETYYMVSSHGRVKSLSRLVTYKDGRSYTSKDKVLSSVPKQGYPAVSFPSRGQICIHLLVAEAFLGDKPATARTVNHIDGNKFNNHASNLEWASYSQNNRHARITKLNRQHGENCNLTFFGDDQIDAIRILAASKRFTYLEIGNMFNMSETHVYEVVSMKSRVNKTVTY